MHPYLFPPLEMSPRALRRILDSIAPNRLDERTDRARFTLREAMAHLADWEPIFLVRIRTAVESPGAEVPSIDVGERANEMGYESWDPRESLSKFEEARRETIAYLRSLRAEAWSAHIFWPDHGRQTVEDMANLLLGHDIYHIEHATEYLGSKTADTW